MKTTCVALAALLAAAPGSPAWAGLARMAPVSVPVGSQAMPVVPVAPSFTGSLSGFVPGAVPGASLLPSVALPQVRVQAPSAAAAAVPQAVIAQSAAGSPQAAPASAQAATPSSPTRDIPAAVAASASSPAAAKSVLENGARQIVRARAAGSPRLALETFFTGAARNGASDQDAVPTAPGKARAAGLAPAPQETAPAAATAVPGPEVEEKPDVKALTGLFIARTASISGFILTVIAYPFLAVPVVGWAGFGTLMAFGPLVAVATGPLNGLIAARLSARKAMVLNAAVRGGLELVLPVAAAFGFLNFWTLLAVSAANGWILNSVMTTEGTYLKRLAGQKHLGTVNALAWMNYLAIQVVLGLILGAGSVVDKWNPATAFYLSAAVHAAIVLPALWLTMPDLAPARPAAAAGPAKGLLERAKDFFKANWLPLAGVVFAAGLYAAFHTTVPMVAALMFWVARTKSFQDVWNGAVRAEAPGDAALSGRALALSRNRLRTAMLYLGLAAFFLYPIQGFVLPAAAAALAGTAGKGLVLGRLLGALFMGNLVSTAARAHLPELILPGGRKLPGQRLIQGLVAALAAGWAFTSLLPGSFLAAGAAALIAAALMAAASRLSETGWLRLLGPGFALLALPYAVWAWGLLPGLGVQAALTVSLLIAGMVFGPAYVALNTYFQRWTDPQKMGPTMGAQGSFFNGAISLAYGLAAALSGFVPLPGLLAVLAAGYALATGLLWLAPRLLPGLPSGFLAPKNPK